MTFSLNKSIANDWTKKAFAICFYRDWTPCCYSCWLSTTPQGVQGEVRHSVLQGIWWDRSLHQFSSVTQSCSTHCNLMDSSMPGLPVHHQLSDFTHSCPLSWWCQPTISSSVMPFSSCLQSFPESWSFPISQLFASGGQSIGVSASTLVLPKNPGLISFRMDWLDLLAVQGSLKSLLQHHNSKTSILQCSAFFIVQLSHPYITTGKTIALTRWTFVWK